MHNDPTEYTPIDKTQYANPYASYAGIPPPPPPPTKNNRHFVIWAFVIILLTAAIVGVSLIGLQIYSHNEHNSTALNTPTVSLTPETTVIIETPTPAPPTPTPQSAISYYASDIYNNFVANGLGGPDPKNDTNWSCCTYAPEGGAIVWTDNTTGYKIDLAVFASIQEAEVDEGQLFAQGFYANVVHDCLLSYEKAVPQNIIRGYVQLMQTYCN